MVHDPLNIKSKPLLNKGCSGLKHILVWGFLMDFVVVCWCVFCFVFAGLFLFVFCYCWILRFLGGYSNRVILVGFVIYTVLMLQILMSVSPQLTTASTTVKTLSGHSCVSVQRDTGRWLEMNVLVG